MAYNSYPYSFYPQYQQPYPQFNNQVQNQTQPQPQQMQIQNGGFVSIRGEQEARNYPIAAGTSITFKDETAPYIYTKTMGFSQLDLPSFEKYRLVKEDAAVTPSEAHTEEVKKEPMDLSGYVKMEEFEALRAEFEGLKNEVDELKIKKGKKEVVKDD